MTETCDEDFAINPVIRAIGVLASTAVTDAAYVFFNAAVAGRRVFGRPIGRDLVSAVCLRGNQLY